MTSTRPLRRRRAALPAGVVLVGVVVAAVPGCGSGGPARLVTPNQGRDPSELARCSVAKSQEQPLVTEWPASYKARLEGLLHGGAVAVEYSGCDLRIVDDCRLPGSYVWKRTTLSTDTTDIHDEDELYAKLPLGALALAGQLRTSGSLHVETTVAGQMQLVGSVVDDTTSGAECSRATHLVRALSVGSFTLRAGGAVEGEAGVSASVAEARGAARQSAAVLREAGSRAGCERSTSDEPSVDCRSPIQIFLTPIRRSVPLDVLSPLPDER